MHTQAQKAALLLQHCGCNALCKLGVQSGKPPKLTVKVQSISQL